MVHAVLPAPTATGNALPTPGSTGPRGRAVRRRCAGITAGWAGAIWISQHIEPDPLLNELALFVHLAALVAGMGAELTLDWFGLRWLLGHHDRADVMRLAGGSQTLIWAGLAALTFSGMDPVVVGFINAR
jgi:hypothetical protein